MNGHGGKRPGAGRPKKWSFEVMLRVGQACENKWRDEVARAFDAASAKMFGFDADLVALWEAVQKVPLGERRAWLAGADGEMHQADVEVELDEQCEIIGRGLIRQFTGDKGTHNFDRIMRLPGTVNWPNEQKKRRGCVPRLATVAWPDLGISYRMSDLLSAFGSGVPPIASPADDITLGEIELINADDLQLGPDE